MPLSGSRYEGGATVITRNRDYNEWPLVDRSVKIVIEGKSYRMDSFVRRSRELPQLSEDSQ